MNILTAIKALLAAVNALFGWLDRKQLLDAGKAQANADSLVEARKRLDDALNAPVTDELRDKRFRD